MSELLQSASGVPDLLRFFHTSATAYSDGVHQHAQRISTDPAGGVLAALVMRLRLLATRFRELGLRSLQTADQLLQADAGSLVPAVRGGALAAIVGSKRWSAVADGPSTRILRFDRAGDGRIVEAFGDIQRADHIAIVVPGMTNTLDNYPAQLRAKALALHAAMQSQQGSSPVAVIAWLGYDTPNGSPMGLVDAAGSTLARRGARQLVDDLRVLRSLRPSAHLTVIGHSYGSVVLGHALRAGLPVDDAIAVGSPGMGASSVRALSTPARVWASVAPNRTIRVPVVAPSGSPISTTIVFGSVPAAVPRDPVRYAPSHGPDPSSPRFGARRLDAPDAVDHGDYFRSGSATLANLAAVAVRAPAPPTVRATSPNTSPGASRK